MSAAQKKVIDDHCTNEWARKVAGPWADFEHAGVQKLKADSAHEVYPISAEQVAEWRKAAEPLQKTWADNVKKAGGNSDAAMKELKESLAKYPGGVLSLRPLRGPRGAWHAGGEHVLAAVDDGGDAQLQVTDTGDSARADAAAWIASSTPSSGWRRSSSASSPPTSSSPCCCATSSRWRSPTAMISAACLLGILIFWGIAATSYRGGHITVDLVWANVGPR